MRFEASPATFRVTELPLFPPAGRGEHLWLVVQKRGIDTPLARRRLAAWLGVSAREVGCAGLKDAASTSIQHFTVPAGGRSPMEVFRRARARGGPELCVLQVLPHDRRLRTGQLAGNRFRCLVRAGPPEALQLGAGLRRAARRGAPNAFGPQRQGRDGHNAERGRRVLRGELRARRELSRLWVSALQALIFDAVLEQRWQDGVAQLPGDRLVPAGRRSARLAGRLHRLPRPETGLRRGLLAPSGVLPGWRTPWAEGEAGRLEREAAVTAGWPPGLPRKIQGFRVDGSRRALVVFPGRVSCRAGRGRAILGFDLPAGSYASVLLAHLMRSNEGGGSRL